MSTIHNTICCPPDKFPKDIFWGDEVSAKLISITDAIRFFEYRDILGFLDTVYLHSREDYVAMCNGTIRVGDFYPVMLSIHPCHYHNSPNHDHTNGGLMLVARNAKYVNESKDAILQFRQNYTVGDRVICELYSDSKGDCYEHFYVQNSIDESHRVSAYGYIPATLNGSLSSVEYLKLHRPLCSPLMGNHCSDFYPMSRFLKFECRITDINEQFLLVFVEVIQVVEDGIKLESET